MSIQYSLLSRQPPIQNLASRKVTARVRASAALAALAALVSVPASAQLRVPNETSIGLQLGQSRAHVPCARGFGCDRDDQSVRVTLGRLFSPYFGVELGAMDNGHVSRGGGDTRIRSADLSLVGRYPIDRFAVYGKLGAAYGRTTTNADLLSFLPTGTASGWGPTYAAGVSYDLTANWTVLAEYQRSRLKFAGSTHGDVDNASVGVNFRF